MLLPKERILNTTFELFHKQGYNSTGINQIIAEAKVAKASFYQHFSSKENLCLEFLKIRHQFWFEELIKFTSKKNNAKEKVISSFNFLIYMNKKEDFRGCSFLNILSEIQPENTKILTCIQNHKKDLRHYFFEILKEKYVSDHVYLLFESSIIESQMFKSNELIEQSKNIINTLIK